jgi:hypothetical protein
MGQRRVKNAVRGARDTSAFRFAARLGFAVNGLLHAIIGALAIAIAVKSGGGSADQSGALAEIAKSPGGGIVLWFATIGLAALGVWLVVGVFFDRTANRTQRRKNRVVEIGKGVAYLFLAGTALIFALGGSTNSAKDTRSMSAAILDAPGGVLLMILLAALVIAIGVYFVAKGARKTFKADIRVPRGSMGRVVVALGVVGYVAKGLVLGVAGILLAGAALTVDASKAAGLDGALKSLVELPFGQLIVILMGLGLIAYGAYSFVRARLARL